MIAMVKHPAKYSDIFLPLFAKKLAGYTKILDPMAGTGKIAKIREFGWCGHITCNEIEPEFMDKQFNIDQWHFNDAAALTWSSDNQFDAICTSPTYGNRLADHWNRHDSSVRFSYTFCLGKDLHASNTGKMHWSAQYREKSHAIWIECRRVLRQHGLLIVNISDHIRNKQLIPVVDFHKETLLQLHFHLKEDLVFETPRLRFGANAEARVKNEHILIFEKEEKN